MTDMGVNRSSWNAFSRTWPELPPIMLLNKDIRQEKMRG